jgi:hypothetical protein
VEGVRQRLACLGREPVDFVVGELGDVSDFDEGRAELIEVAAGI